MTISNIDSFITISLGLDRQIGMYMAHYSKGDETDADLENRWQKIVKLHADLVTVSDLETANRFFDRSVIVWRDML